MTNIRARAFLLLGVQLVTGIGEALFYNSLGEAQKEGLKGLKALKAIRFRIPPPKELASMAVLVLITSSITALIYSQIEAALSNDEKNREQTLTKTT